jgi:hypothetical protein
MVKIGVGDEIDHPLFLQRLCNLGAWAFTRSALGVLSTLVSARSELSAPKGIVDLRFAGMM